MEQILEHLEKCDDQYHDILPHMNDIKKIVLIPLGDGEITDKNSDIDNTYNLNHLISA